MDISVIIVNYNVRDFLNNALVSLEKSLKGFSSEIFVVDNASDDGSVEHVKKYFPAVHLIANTVNAGFAKANNTALARSTGDYILMINPDTVVQEDTISTVISFFEQHHDAGLVGCKILNPDGTFQLPCRRSFPTPWIAFTKTFGLSSLFPASKIFAKYNLTYLDPDKTYEVDAVSGSFMAIRREVYEKIGGFDETFFMYGEDLDLCFRIKHNGWKVYYVPETSIIHYKGESTKRSDIDELKIFYNAMRLFVRKHHSGSPIFEWFIYSGIYLRKYLANFGRVIKPLLIGSVDILIVNLSILGGEFVRKNSFFALPLYAYPWIFIVPAFVAFATLFFFGVYTDRKLSVSRSFAAVVTAYIVISAITAFVVEFAFSRMIVLISGGLSVVLIPGWRLIVRLMGFGGSNARTTLFGRRTLIVGTDRAAQDILKKLRARMGGGYSIVGFIDTDRQRIGQKIADVEILGSVDTISRIIHNHRITEVIFSSDAVPYSTVLAIIANNRNRFVNFRLVPTNLEVIIGKSSIDQLDDIPFIDIDYNISKLGNRVVKRVFDLAVSLFLLISIAPFVYFSRLFRSSPATGFSKAILSVPAVVAGRMSIVGYYENGGVKKNDGFFRGKPGITGVLHIRENSTIGPDEKDQLELYYAKNQSFLFDLEILVKSLQRWIHG